MFCHRDDDIADGIVRDVGDLAGNVQDRAQQQETGKDAWGKKRTQRLCHEFTSGWAGYVVEKLITAICPCPLSGWSAVQGGRIRALPRSAGVSACGFWPRLASKPSPHGARTPRELAAGDGCATFGGSVKMRPFKARVSSRDRWKATGRARLSPRGIPA
jgi:hypothetical protein